MSTTSKRWSRSATCSPTVPAGRAVEELVDVEEPERTVSALVENPLCELAHRCCIERRVMMLGLEGADHDGAGCRCRVAVSSGLSL